MSLIQSIALRRIARSETPKSQKQFLNWKQVSSVLLIAADNQLADIADFINTCKQDNVKVQVAVLYNGKPEQAPKPHFEHVILDRRQFSFLGLPTDACLQKMGVKAYDVLIDLGTASQSRFLALSKMLKARCKISSFQNEVFDLSIDSEKSLPVSDFLKQVVVYLNMIKPSPNE